MAEPVYEFRRSIAAKAETYRLADASLIRSSAGVDDRFPFADIRAIRIYQSPGLGAAGGTVAPAFERCVIWPKRGRAIVLSSNHFLSLGKFEDRSASFRPFVDALVQGVAAANPETALLAGMPRGLWWFWIVVLLGAAIVTPLAVLFIIINAVREMSIPAPLLTATVLLLGVFLGMLTFIRVLWRNRPRRFRPPVAIVALAALLAGSPADPASALSCAQPMLDEARIAAAVVIFEGSAGSPRSPTRAERRAFESSGLSPMGGSAATLKVFPFTVSTPWKGVREGQRVEVIYNTAWGDSFADRGPYLVVSPRRLGDLFWAPLCGNTTHVDAARQLGDIARLERFVGLGHHLRIKTTDRLCARDEECATIQTHCGGCSCGTPAAKSAVERLQGEFTRFCAIIRISEICERHCAPRIARRRDALCVIE